MDRYSFANEWFSKGDHLISKYEITEEPGLLFEAYIYLWISLTVSVKQYWACDGRKFNSQHGKIATDKQEIRAWAKQFNSRIYDLLQENRELLEELSMRKGSETNNPVMDSNGDAVYHLNAFSDYWLNNTNQSRIEIVATFIDILNRVRNNLFHGGKSFSNEQDIEILRLACPLLRELSKLSLKIL